MIKSFSILNEDEKIKFYHFIKMNTSIPKYDIWLNDMVDELFNNGDSLLAIIENHQIKGSIGIITKDVTYKNEVFITYFYLLDDDIEIFHSLIDAAEKYLIDFHHIKIKLGIRKNNMYVIPFILKKGYKSVYNINLMNLKEKSKIIEISDCKGINYLPLKEAKDDFLRIHNEAFIDSQNGAILSKEEVEKLVGKTHDLIKIAYYNGYPIGVFEITFEDSIGYIDTIGISPKYQGQGFGKYILKEAVINLIDRGIDDIQLMVVDKNIKAVSLYKKYGFMEKEIISIWFEKAI